MQSSPLLKSRQHRSNLPVAKRSLAPMCVPKPELVDEKKSDGGRAWRADCGATTAKGTVPIKMGSVQLQGKPQEFF